MANEIFDQSAKHKTYDNWANFKAFIDGTSGSLAYSYTLFEGYYYIVTEPFLGYNLRFQLENTGSAALTEWENNYKNSTSILEGSNTAFKIQGISGSFANVDGFGSLAVTGTVGLSEAIPEGENTIGFVKITDSSGSQPRSVGLVYDANAEINRLAVTAKVTISAPVPPSGTLEVILAADNPLSVTTTHDTTRLITSGSIFFIQQVVAGAAGDPNEKGSKVEIYYDNGTEHLIERIYILGSTQFGSYPDTSQTRDGLFLSGSGTESIIIRRTRLGGSAQEIDAVLRGFEKL